MSANLPQLTPHLTEEAARAVMSRLERVDVTVALYYTNKSMSSLSAGQAKLIQFTLLDFELDQKDDEDDDDKVRKERLRREASTGIADLFTSAAHYAVAAGAAWQAGNAFDDVMVKVVQEYGE